MTNGPASIEEFVVKQDQRKRKLDIIFSLPRNAGLDYLIYKNEEEQNPYILMQLWAEMQDGLQKAREDKKTLALNITDRLTEINLSDNLERFPWETSLLGEIPLPYLVKMQKIVKPMIKEARKDFLDRSEYSLSLKILINNSKCLDKIIFAYKYPEKTLLILEKLIRTKRGHDRLYYRDSTPKILDEDYDALIREIDTLAAAAGITELDGLHEVGGAYPEEDEKS